MAGALGGVLISLGITALAQRQSPLPLRELQQFASVFAAIKSSYVEPVSDEKLINDAIKGLFSDLDPHSAYLNVEAFKEMETITQGGFGGLGIEIGREENMPKVIAPIEDTPAARAGIMAGDFITHIDGKPTVDMTLDEAIKLMRGEPKTSVELTIRRAGAAQPLKVTIVRDLIKVRSVRSKMLDDNIAYVRVAQFQERTTADLADHLAKLSAAGTPKGLVLDLRNDPGGLLDAAIGVSTVFLQPELPVVSTKGRIPSANREFDAQPARFLRRYFSGGSVQPQSGYFSDASSWTKSVPMVVLINAGSASASEIVAGALQDHKRATVMGNRSFGKGSVQSVLPLGDDAGIKLTTALYYTPSGRSIQVTGVEPDIAVDDTAQGNLFRLPREVDLQRHLVNDEVDEADQSGGKATDPASMPKPFEFGGAEDFQLKQAINRLQGRPVQQNDPSLKVASAPSAADAANGKAAADEKKRPMSRYEGQAERYRITPDGAVKVE